MKIVLDTNVFVSGIFFSGPPYRILRAWRDGRLHLVYSAAIFREYERVIGELSREFPGIEGQPFLSLIRCYGDLHQSERVPGISCRDPQDLKFIECLLHSGADYLVTGDKDLLDAKLKTASILTPRQFCDRFL